VRGRIDRLADGQLLEPADRAAADVINELTSHPERSLRDGLFIRLTELPSGHPSAIVSRRERTAGLDPDRLDSQRHPPDAWDRGFWSQVGRFEELWQAHLARWPDSHEKAGEPERRDDRPGSWRGACDRHLNPEDHAEADKQIRLLREPEPAVTRLLKHIEVENPHGAVLVGLEHRLKGAERLKEKIADKISIKGLASPADAARTIGDAVRYTFCVTAEEYVAAHSDIGRQLESAGYRNACGKNHWLQDAHYNGINTQWVTPDGGRFELQFHTRESFYAKEQLTHPPYRRLRQEATTPAERVELLTFQQEVCAAVPKPPGISQIPDIIARRQGD
jgi:hypothetical protein